MQAGVPMLQTVPQTVTCQEASSPLKSLRGLSRPPWSEVELEGPPGVLRMLARACTHHGCAWALTTLLNKVTVNCVNA